MVFLHQIDNFHKYREIPKKRDAEKRILTQITFDLRTELLLTVSQSPSFF